MMTPKHSRISSLKNIFKDVKTKKQVLFKFDIPKQITSEPTNRRFLKIKSKTELMAQKISKSIDAQEKNQERLKGFRRKNSLTNAKMLPRKNRSYNSTLHSYCSSSSIGHQDLFHQRQGLQSEKKMRPHKFLTESRARNMQFERLKTQYSPRIYQQNSLCSYQQKSFREILPIRRINLDLFQSLHQKSKKEIKLTIQNVDKITFSS